MSVASHWSAPPPTYDAPSHMSSTLTPYLQLSHLLSLTWLAYPILSLIFVAFRLQLSLTSAEDAVASAKDNLLASCQAAERAATSAASMPRYLAISSNEQFADVVNGSLNAARATLVLALTAMEAIINFIIDIYRSTLLCFLELVVRGGLSILIGAVNELNDLVKNVASGLSTSIQSSISSSNSAIKDAIDAINKINPFNDITAPQIPVPNLDQLQNISLPPSFQQSLTNLNNSLPTVADLKDKIESIIDTPFELLKKDINDTFATISFNSSVLPIPQQNRLTFCSDMDLSIVDDVGHDLIKMAKIGTIILILLALLLVGLNCLLEWYKWRCMKAHLEYTRQAWTSDPTMVHAKSPSGPPSVTLNDHNLMLLNANSSHPLLTRISNNMSKILRLSPSKHTHLQWFFHYVFHPPALACFLVGFIGLLSVEIQLAAMGPLISKYQDRSAQTASDFSNTIATSINASMYNQSAAYANDVNAHVDAIQTTINQGLFGWVNVTTVTLNTTVATFYDDVQKAVSTVFNGTILDSPAQEFIRCLIGTKVDAIENALTFLHDNLVINMPRVNQTVLVLSPESVNEATAPIAAAAIGGGDNDNEGLIEKIVNSYTASLKKERLMFGIFIALWVFVVFIALCIIFWHSYGRQLVERRKRRRWEREQRVGIDGLVVPFRIQPPRSEGKGAMGTHNDLPSFTPLPSPKGNVFKPFFSRSASPATTKADEGGLSHSAELGEPQERSNWAALFREKFAGGKPVKLMAIGHKAVGKDRSVDDREAGRDQPLLNNRNTAWFSRVAATLDKKEVEPANSHPKLRISIDRTSTELPYDSHTNSSRWSASPEPTTAATSPWKTLRKPPSHPPIGLPVRPKPRNTPSDVGSTFEATLVPPLQSTPLAPPIHHGFDESRYPKISTALAPMTIKSSRSLNYPQQTLAPPNPQQHKRTSSVPASREPAPLSITPVTRLLTTTHARKSSSIDPFVTPFDDEYKVTIAEPVKTRKSIPTNPFNPIVL